MTASIGKLLGMPESSRTYEDNRLLALNKCLTGLEFEAENVEYPLPSDEDEAGFWEEKEDNSLRGASREYVLREPLFGEDLVKATKWLCTWATKKRLESNFRTGFHVHVDVRNMNTAQLITMTVYYALFEKVLFDWVGDSREGSIFCMPMYKAEGVLGPIVTAMKAEKQIKEAAKQIDRYAAYNLNALSRFGTVEWRHMQTTFDFDRVLKWINIAQNFKRYAKQNPMNPKELLAELSSKGPDKIFGSILGPTLGGELWTKASQQHVWDFGVPVAQEIATLLDSTNWAVWDDVRKVIGTGSNPKWSRWLEKQKDNKEFSKAPANPFAEPELLKDPELQKEALSQLADIIRDKLSEGIPRGE